MMIMMMMMMMMVIMMMIVVMMIMIMIRGCPHMMSANFRGFQTPPPPLVSNRQ